MNSVKFLNCRLDLRKKVLVPRIETEFWVKQIMPELKISILDIFAGSGCIGIAVLKNIKNSRVDFADIDKSAIEQIKINLKLNKIPKNRYKICQSNLFEKIKNKYNYILANPPYVARERIKEVAPEVLKFEPEIALFSGKKGLFLIKKFLKQEKNYLNNNGVIFMEFDPLQKEDIKKMLEKFGYKKYKFFKDQFNKYRFVKINS